MFGNAPSRRQALTPLCVAPLPALPSSTFPLCECDTVRGSSIGLRRDRLLSEPGAHGKDKVVVVSPREDLGCSACIAVTIQAS
jgi:hypothetical protein